MASRSMAAPASRAPIFGGNSRFDATPTAAPTSVSLMRSHAAESVLNDPTPSTSMALMGTSMRLAPMRSACPMTIDKAIRMARLHQVRSTKVAKVAASDTPTTTLSTRSRPLARRLTGVSCTTSSAVSGASSGVLSGKISLATTNAATAAAVSRRAQPRADHPPRRNLSTGEVTRRWTTPHSDCMA
jgi:hypothetical protein